MPSSIPRDCSTDVTTALQSWLDGVPDHVTMSLATGACYRIEGTLVLTDRHQIVLAGNGATLKASTVGNGNRRQLRSRCQLSIIASSNITVQNLIVRGANPHAGIANDAYQPRLEAQHAFSLRADDYVTLDHVQAYDVYGDFVYIGGTAGRPSRHIAITNSQFERSGRQGISVTDGEDVRIVSNRIGFIRRSLFDLEPNTRTGEARRIRIERNITGPVHNYWLADKGAGTNVGDIVVSHNVMQAPSGALVLVFGPDWGKRGPFTFVGNDFQTTGAISDEHATGAFLFANASGVNITGNRVRVPVDAHIAGVELRATNNVIIAGNQFVGTTRPMLSDSTSRNVASPS